MHKIFSNNLDMKVFRWNVSIALVTAGYFENHFEIKTSACKLLVSQYSTYYINRPMCTL